MSTIPQSPVKQVEFFEARTTAWQTNAVAIGLAELEVTNFIPKVALARTDYQAMVTARAAADAAAETFNNTARAMALAGADLVRKIRTTALTSHDPAVYAMALIPPPKPAAPVGAPGTPTALNVQLMAGGSLRLKWRCPNPADAGGTVYEIRRQDGSGQTVHLSTVGRRRYDDASIPAGTAQVVYTITPIRSTLRGPEAQFLVKFGSAETGTTVAGARLQAEPQVKAA